MFPIYFNDFFDRTYFFKAALLHLLCRRCLYNCYITMEHVSVEGEPLWEALAASVEKDGAVLTVSPPESIRDGSSYSSYSDSDMEDEACCRIMGMTADTLKHS